MKAKLFIFGTLLLLFSFMLLAKTADAQGLPGEGDKCPAGFQEEAGVCFPTESGLPDPAEGIGGILKNLLLWFLGIFGALAIIAFIISGIQYLTSAGDEGTIETAKRNMKWSMIGVVVALSGFVIVMAIDAALRATSTTF